LGYCYLRNRGVPKGGIEAYMSVSNSRISLPCELNIIHMITFLFRIFFDQLLKEGSDYYLDCYRVKKETVIEDLRRNTKILLPIYW
jgi:hypothetical protein